MDDQSVFRVTDDLAFNIPALPRPTLKELKEKYPNGKFSKIQTKSIERDTSPTEAVTLQLGTILRVDEDSIGGDEYERRLAPKLDIILGYQQAVWLMDHLDEFPSLVVILRKVYIDFPGLIMVGADGNRNAPYFEGGAAAGGRIAWHLVGCGFHKYGRIAVSSNL